MGVGHCSWLANAPRSSYLRTENGVSSHCVTAPGAISVRIALQTRIEGWDKASPGRFLSGQLQYAHFLRKTEAANTEEPILQCAVGRI